MKIVLLFGTLIIISCGQKKTHMEYLLSWRNSGRIDTIYTDILSRQSNDTVDILNYRFDPRQTEWPAYEQEFILPKQLDSVGTNGVSLVYERTLNFEDKEYRILKYQYDVDGDDDESLYFYTPDFGIILFHWGTHRNSQRLIHTGDGNKDKIIYYLTDKIENDPLMTKSW